MGCDIHFFVEYRPKKISTRNIEYSHEWRTFIHGIHMPRNYNLFGIMAGVREGEGNKALFYPRGLPDDVGFYTREANINYPVDVFDGEDLDQNECTLIDAKRWVESGFSQWVEGGRMGQKAVTNPDWHSHSWLNIGEFRACLNKLDAMDPEADFVEYLALYASMGAFEESNCETRIVFWFDN